MSDSVRNSLIFVRFSCRFYGTNTTRMSDLDQFDSYLLTARASSDFLNFGMTTNANDHGSYCQKGVVRFCHQHLQWTCIIYVFGELTSLILLINCELLIACKSALVMPTGWVHSWLSVFTRPKASFPLMMRRLHKRWTGWWISRREMVPFQSHQMAV